MDPSELLLFGTFLFYIQLWQLLESNYWTYFLTNGHFGDLLVLIFYSKSLKTLICIYYLQNKLKYKIWNGWKTKYWEADVRHCSVQNQSIHNFLAAAPEPSVTCHPTDHAETWTFSLEWTAAIFILFNIQLPNMIQQLQAKRFNRNVISYTIIFISLTHTVYLIYCIHGVCSSIGVTMWLSREEICM